MQVPCPRCGQDYVVKARVKPLNLVVKFCPECDAFWHEDWPISVDKFLDLGTFLEEHGLPWRWEFFEVLADE